MYWFDETAPVGAGRQVTFFLDNDLDVTNLPTHTRAGSNLDNPNDTTLSRPVGIGSKAFVIGSARLYMLDSNDNWVEVGEVENESYA